jgi:hypothetical protein
MSDLRLNLYENGMDSIRHGIEHYTSDQEDRRRYKYAILHLCQGVLLLLKERLRMEHPNFIYQDVAKPEKTVDVRTALDRLETIAGLDLSASREPITQLAAIRNNIEHYALDLSKNQADVLIGQVVPFMVSFAKVELGKDFVSEIGSHNWAALLAIREYLENAIRIAKATIRSEGKIPHFCPNCQDLTGAIQPFRQAQDGTGLEVSEADCLVCSSTLLRYVKCLGCNEPIELKVGQIPRIYSYCDSCRERVSSRFPGFSRPEFVAEVEKWFQSHSHISTRQLFDILSSVASFGSSGPRYLFELLHRRAIDFVHDLDRETYRLRANRGLLDPFEPETNYRWIFEPEPDDAV